MSARDEFLAPKGAHCYNIRELVTKERPMKKGILAIVMLFAASCVFAEGLDTLIEVGEGQKEIAKEQEQETKSFEAVKRAIDSGKLKEGQSKSSIRDGYGEPVIVTQEAGNREKWVYMPAASTFFKGIKIYLFFDESERLTEIKVTA
jgi:hypothetical protein